MTIELQSVNKAQLPHLTFFRAAPSSMKKYLGTILVAAYLLSTALFFFLPLPSELHYALVPFLGWGAFWIWDVVVWLPIPQDWAFADEGLLAGITISFVGWCIAVFLTIMVALVVNDVL